jgi:integrase/recombinase XerD
MNALEKGLTDYVALHRSMGFKFQNAEWYLTRFVSFMNQRGARRITTQLAYEWATQPARAKPATLAARLGFVHRFARYMQADHPDTEVPPLQLIAAHNTRANPYLYSREEITRLMAAAQALSPGNRLPGLSYRYLIGLLAVTGLRISEAMALTNEDVDLNLGILTVRASKLGKSRLIPLHRSTTRMLNDYARQRDALIGEPRSPYFLVASWGGRLWGPTVRVAFYALSRRIGLRQENDRHGPRLHDLRHRFAVETLRRWYSSGQDVEVLLPSLSTYMGHVNIQDTYWYLSACPELTGVAAQRLQRRWEAFE